MSNLTDRQIRTDVQMQAVARAGEVHLLFSEEDSQTKQMRPAYTANFLMTAQQGLQLAGLLADLAFEADTSLKPVGPALKAELVERHRIKLTKRIEVVMNSTREKRKVSNRQLAQQLVEIALKEVFS